MSQVLRGSTGSIHRQHWKTFVMGTWYLSLAVSLFLILVGIYIHWSVVLVGALLPFVPMVSILLERRRRRTRRDDR